MSEWLISIEGTETGQTVALCLALLAAFLHAAFGALQKGKHDPWLSRGAIDGCYGLIALPVALFLVPWPEPHMWPIFAGAFVIHAAYKFLQAAAYTQGAYTVVYPVVRGTGPLFAMIGAILFFGESYSAMQWLGVAILVSGIFGLAVYNLIFLEVDRAKLPSALALAVATGVFVALYTTYDAFGIRATADPFTFLAWFFVVDGWLMPLVALWRLRSSGERPEPWPLLRRGVIGAFVAYFSFGSIMLATRLDQVGEAAVLRETSTVFAAIIGWLVLRETVGPRRIALMALIALGAVVVEMGG
ncbi:SMR family transporter [Citreimonas sp.]|uniref:SMR family transporter n=1 Tax=Citreimonas sp. TaxID=3036715 RepID=UPI0035C8108C